MSRAAEVRRGGGRGAAETPSPASASVVSPASSPPAGGRMAGGERRQQILSVAMSLFSQRGFRGTTTKEIAAAAGVSEAMVFRHFATKEELYSAIIDFKACSGGLGDPCEILGEAIRQKDDRLVFEQLGRALMRHHEEDPEFLRLLTHAALEEHELAQMFWERTIRQLYEFLGGYVRERQREGAMRGVDPMIIVRAFIGMIIHHSLNNTLWDKRRSLIDITNERAAREFTDLLLRGVAPAPAPPAPAREGKDGKDGKGRRARAPRAKKR